MDIWKEVDEFLSENEDTYKMSFGLEFSNVIGWVADFTPRKNHPQARNYGLWQGQHGNRDKAIIRALEEAKVALSYLKNENIKEIDENEKLS